MFSDEKRITKIIIIKKGGGIYEAKLNSEKKMSLKEKKILKKTPQKTTPLKGKCLSKAPPRGQLFFVRGTASPGLGCAGNYALLGIYYFCFLTHTDGLGSR